MDKINTLVTIQKNYINKLNNPLKLDINYRIKLLKNLKNTILKYEKEIEKAVYKDLGRSKHSTYLAEISSLLLELNYFISNLKKLTKVKKMQPSTLFLGCKGYTKYCPFGIVLVISPWNYPILLSLSPLIGAISSGNTVILKPSEYSKNCSNLLKKIINEALPKECAEVVLGDYNEVTELINLKMDFIFFTGSTNIGKIIMEKAAKNLTPVSLELGGKSPCILDKTANLNMSVKRIAWGKTLNAGQTCISPDYLIIHEDLLNIFVDKFNKYILEFFGSCPLKNEHYTRIINEKNYNRIINYLNNQNIIYGGKYDDKTLKIEPTLILNPSFEDLIMKEEIFAPILPIITYKNKDEIYEIIEKNKNPLALYIFSNDTHFQNELVNNIACGDCCINTTILHTVNFNLPFGGIGNSGIGNYHGKYSFELFSHKKSVLKSNFIIDNTAKYPPYSNFKLTKKLLNLLIKK